MRRDSCGFCPRFVNFLLLCVFQIEEITFKNYYTAYVTVRLLRRSPGQEAPAKWCTALRDLPLMDNPHSEGGSQDYYSIHRTQVGLSPVRQGGSGLLLTDASTQFTWGSG